MVPRNGKVTLNNRIRFAERRAEGSERLNCKLFRQFRTRRWQILPGGSHLPGKSGRMNRCQRRRPVPEWIGLALTRRAALRRRPELASRGISWYDFECGLRMHQGPHGHRRQHQPSDCLFAGHQRLRASPCTPPVMIKANDSSPFFLPLPCSILFCLETIYGPILCLTQSATIGKSSRSFSP
jgi:hypothetical protein